MGNKSNSYLINATSKFTLHEIALNLHGPVLKACFRKSHPQPKCISLLRCKQRALLVATAAVSEAVCPSKIRPNDPSRVQTFTLCTISFIHPHREKSNSMKSRDLTGQLWGSPRPIHRTAKRPLRKSLIAHENEEVLRHCEFMRPSLLNIASFKICGNSSRGNCR